MTITGLWRTLIWFIASILSVWAHDSTVAYSAGWAWFCSVGMKAKALKAFLKHMTGTSVCENIWTNMICLCHIMFLRCTEAPWVSDGLLDTRVAALRVQSVIPVSLGPECSRPNVQMASAICSMMLSCDHHMSPQNWKPYQNRRACLHAQHTPIKIYIRAIFWLKQY